MRGFGLLLCCVLMLGSALPALAQGPAAPAQAREAEPPSTVWLHHRRVVDLRASVLGDSPAEGAELAREALELDAASQKVEARLNIVLRQLAYTRPWGEGSTARLLTRANTLYMQRIERGELQLSWLDIDTAGPIRRLGNLVLWLFAPAMACPCLPGASTDAFKGLTVLAGLMLSRGGSGVVGQMMAGLSLTDSRSLRVGEHMKIGDAEGTVTPLGLFTTKIRTGLGEEVGLPSTVVSSQPVRNFPRLVKDGQFTLQAAVTIGDTTPWRQVRAMQLEAARRTSGIVREPGPYGVQAALSDFDVEYRPCAQDDRSAPRRRADAIDQLNAPIQDVFDENGVQIMSPHYRSDPAEPQGASPGPWFPARQPIDPPSAEKP